MTQLEKTVAKRFGQRLTVILTITKFCQARNHGSEVVRITGFQFVQELPHRAATGRRLIEPLRRNPSLCNINIDV